jgi:hypothetical protein
MFPDDDASKTYKILLDVARQAPSVDECDPGINNMFTAMDISDPKRQKAMFLHYIGEKPCVIIDTLTITAPTGEEGAPTACGLTITAFTDHIETQRCTDHHVFAFRKEQ